MNGDLISIIVPVYNVKPFLDECISSIISQTYAKLEIIIVDDGSTDNCSAICDKWAEKDNRITVIHKTNGGLSDARNAGLAVATGDYIGFVDADDYIRSDMYEILINDIITKESDIAMCGVMQFWESGKTLSFTKDVQGVFDTDAAILELLHEESIKQPVWYKLYKKEVIKDLLFPVGKLHEDVLWSYHAIGNAKRVSVNNSHCYFYRQRTESIMGAKFTLRRLDAIVAKCESVEYIRHKFPQYTDVAISNLWFACIYSMQRVLRDIKGEDKRIGKQIILSAFNIERISFRSIFNTRGKQRIWLCLSKFSLVLTARVRNLLKKGL